MYLVFTQPIVNPETLAPIVDRGEWLFASAAPDKLAALKVHGVDHVPGITWVADLRTLEVILADIDAAVA